MNIEKEGWHLDKRVSIASLLMAATSILTVLFFVFQLDKKIDVNSVRITQNEKLIMQDRSERSLQYQEIIRRLEVLQSQLNEDKRRAD